MIHKNESGSVPVSGAGGEPVKLGEFNGFEIYPMPVFTTISVADVTALKDWYIRALGFGVVFEAPPVNGQPAIVHLRRRKYQDVLVVPGVNNNSHEAPSMTLNFQTEDLDDLSRQANAAPALGASKVEGPVNTPWNTRDLRITDPVGNRLVFTSHNANADPEQVERMRKMLEAGRK